MALNSQNLIPVTERDPERAREIRSMGGKASQAKMRQNRNLREAFLAVQGVEIKGKDGTVKTASDAIALALLQKAVKGDLKAIEFLWEALYGRQTKVDVTSSDGSMSPPQKIDLGDRSPEELLALVKAMKEKGSEVGDGTGK